jgi:Sulfotransferase family
MAAERAADGEPSPRPRTVYVMGAGRSGSTILGVALGNSAGVFFAGELHKWVPRSGRPSRADGDAERVEFWRAVRERVREPDALFERGAHRHLERSSALLRPGRARARRRLRPTYRRLMAELYDAIAASSGSDYVVDTSHYPLRAHELQRLASIDMYLILLVRDPRAVVDSFARGDVAERQFGALTTRAYLALTYLISAWVFVRHPRERRLLLVYEDLLRDPEGVLRDVLDRLGSSADVADLDALDTGVPLHGNRLLASDVVAFERGAATPPAHGFASRLFARLLLGLLGRLRPRARSASRSPQAAGRQ